MTRKTACTPELTKEIATNIKMGMSNQDAVNLAGISHTAFYNWLNRGEAELERVAAGSGRKIRKNEQPFVDFVEAIKSAIPARKQILIGRIQRAAQGGETITETYKKYRKGVVVEERHTTKTRAAEWQAAAWLLERLHYDEFGRRSRVDVYDWRKELKELWDAGAITEQDILDELGTSLAQEFFESAGINYAGLGSAETES